MSDAPQVEFAKYTSDDFSSPAEKMAATKKPRGKRSYSAHKSNLKKVRSVVGLTIREVAEGTGLSNAFICQVEQGGEISLTNARKLSRFFGKSIDELWPQENQA